MIGVLDYNAGNLCSVMKALDHINAEACLVRTVEECAGIDRLIVPGVGAFGSAIDRLRSSGLFDLVDQWLAVNRPFLGICLGMQVLCTGSDETGDVPGFARLPLRARHFASGKVPQIGWNQVKKIRSSRLLQDIEDNSFFYFLHGYYLGIVDDFTVGTTDYGITYSSVIEHDSLCAVQFHPEKSGAAGLALLRNWVERC
ncbi:imidazole glycerol phosphate synthase subunit HisH [candidate division WOR-3 bacterium]|nr:imidazole glycerol phosphate synthase subunit HisH [candidate division WOR-3 bacterium]